MRYLGGRFKGCLEAVEEGGEVAVLIHVHHHMSAMTMEPATCTQEEESLKAGGKQVMVSCAQVRV